MISITDDFCGGAILDIAAVSVLDVVFMLGGSRGAVCLRLHCSTFSTVTRNCSTEIANLGAFFGASPVRQRRANAICLIAGKPIEAMERLAVEGKSGHVENEPRIVSTSPRRKPPAEPAAWIGIIFLTI